MTLQPMSLTQTPPRILHLVTDSASLGMLRGQLRHLRGRGFDAQAVSAPGPLADLFATTEGVPVHAIPFRRAISPWHDVVALIRLWQLFRRLRPAIVHCGTPKAGLLGIVAATLARVPHRIYHIRGLRFMGSHGLARTLLKTTERIACTLAHRVLSNSGSIRHLALLEGICPDHKIRVIANGSSNGVDAAGAFDPRAARTDEKPVRATLGIPGRAPVVGFVGRLTRDKGVVELVRAWSTLRDQRSDLHLVCVGPDESDDAVTAAAIEQLRGDPRAHVVESVAEPAPFYRAMDVVCLPSHREGFPKVLLEAAAMERPVVATCIPGCIDAVEDGRTGTLVPLGDVGRLTAALAGYLDDADRRARHGRTARRRVLRLFAQEIVWNWLAQEYEAVTRGSHVSARAWA